MFRAPTCSTFTIIRSVLLCLLALLFMVPASRAQIVLAPGEYRENIAAAGRVVETTNAPHLTAQVGFSRADALTQNMHLVAGAQTVLTSTAKARGELYVDFCVPRSGLGVCDTQSDPTAPDIAVNLTFKYGMIGEVISNFLSKASFSASAAIVDLERSQYVAYQALGSLSVNGGKTKDIKEVPVPLPNFGEATETLPVTFSTFLRRGKVYRFQLAGAASATSTADESAVANFYNLVVQNPPQQGRVQLYNLSIQVGQEAPSLTDQMAALQQVVNTLTSQVGALADRVDLIGDQLDEQFAGLSQSLYELSQRTAGPGALLLRQTGAPAPEGALLLGSVRLVPAGGKASAANLVVDVYLMPTTAANPAAAPPRGH